MFVRRYLSYLNDLSLESLNKFRESVDPLKLHINLECLYICFGGKWSTVSIIFPKMCAVLTNRIHSIEFIFIATLIFQVQKPRPRKLMGLNQYLDPNFLDLRPSAWPTGPQCIPSPSISKKSKQAVLIRAWEWSVIAALNRKCMLVAQPWDLGPFSPQSSGPRAAGLPSGSRRCTVRVAAAGCLCALGGQGRCLAAWGVCFISKEELPDFWVGGWRRG